MRYNHGLKVLRSHPGKKLVLLCAAHPTELCLAAGIAFLLLSLGLILRRFWPLEQALGHSVLLSAVSLDSGFSLPASTLAPTTHTRLLHGVRKREDWEDEKEVKLLSWEGITGKKSNSSALPHSSAFPHH